MLRTSCCRHTPDRLVESTLLRRWAHWAFVVSPELVLAIWYHNRKKESATAPQSVTRRSSPESILVPVRSERDCYRCCNRAQCWHVSRDACRELEFQRNLKSRLLSTVAPVYDYLHVARIWPHDQTIRIVRAPVDPALPPVHKYARIVRKMRCTGIFRRQRKAMNIARSRNSKCPGKNTIVSRSEVWRRSLSVPDGFPLL